MKALWYFPLVIAVVIIAYSAVVTVKTLCGLFKGESSSDDTQKKLKTLRNKLIISYAVSALFIIAAAAMKLNG